jgi:hypothetical protein
MPSAARRKAAGLFAATGANEARRSELLDERGGLVEPGLWCLQAEKPLALAPGQRRQILHEMLELACLHVGLRLGRVWLDLSRPGRFHA